MFFQYLQSPIGIIRVEASDEGITAVKLNLDSRREEEFPNDHTQICGSQLSEYFSRERTVFELDYDMSCGTYFQKTVWKALQQIPFGSTISYATLSKRLGNIKAIRAVGAANGKNPIAICIPCHRVIGSDGSLTGYASGIDIKQKLLMLENPKVFGTQTSLAF